MMCDTSLAWIVVPGLVLLLGLEVSVVQAVLWMQSMLFFGVPTCHM